MGRARKESNKIQPTFNKEQLRLIRSFRGVFGEDDAEIVRYIVTNWLLEKIVLSKRRNYEKEEQ